MSRQTNKPFKVPPTISFSIIGRDESANIRRMFESIVPIADEIIYVDTGSVDNTVEIAKEYTDKIYYFKWIDDYAAARNFADSKCTKGWIFSIDCDEVIHKREYWKITAAAKNPKLIAHFIGTKNYCNKYYSNCKLSEDEYKEKYKWFHESHKIRMYQNLPKVRWVGKIHEQIKDSVLIYCKDGSQIAGIGQYFDIWVLHFQVEQEERSNKKKQMYYEYGIEKLKKDRSFNTLYETAALCVEMGKLEEAKELLEEAWRAKTPLTRPEMISNIKLLLYSTYARLELGTPDFNEFFVIKAAESIYVEDPPVSVVTVTYGNQIEPTVICLDSILPTLTNKSDELIIVANQPSEELEKTIRNYKEGSKVKLIINRKSPTGWTQACNQGGEAAKNKYLILSNNDVLFPVFWKSELLKYFNLNPKVAAVGGVSGDIGEHSGQLVKYPFTWKDAKDFKLKEGETWELVRKSVISSHAYDRLKKYRFKYAAVDLLLGWCFAIKKDLFNEIGGFDSESFGNSMGFDDNDLSLRLKIAGYQLIIARDVLMYHMWQRNLTSRWLKGQAENQKRFLEKWKDILKLS